MFKGLKSSQTQDEELKQSDLKSERARREFSVTDAQQEADVEEDKKSAWSTSASTCCTDVTSQQRAAQSFCTHT